MRALLESCSVALITKSEPVPKVVAITAVALCLLGVLASVRRLTVVMYIVYKTLIRVAYSWRAVFVFIHR